MISFAQFIGVTLIVLGLCSFALNSFMIYVFVAKRLIVKSHENYAIYRLILNFLVCDTIQVTPTIYLGICAAVQSELLPDDMREIPGSINLWTWYQMMLMLITMAANRYVGICHFNKYASIFTARTAAIVIVVTWLISGAYMITNQFILQCCAMITYYPIYTFIYRTPPPGQENLVTKYKFPTTEVCCGILVFCYIRILWTVHKTSREALTTMTRSVQRHRIRQNIRFAIQFVFISIFFVLMYAFYSIFPKLLPKGVQLPYSAIAYCMIAHCSINSLMYLTFNPEVRRLTKQTLCCNRGGWGGRSDTQNFHRTHISSTLAPRIHLRDDPAQKRDVVG